jgi:hypothetical protein
MLKCRADRGDGGLDFFLRRVEHPAVNGHGCLNCLDTGVKVDRCEHGMDESSGPPPARPFFVRARTDYHLNVGIDRLRMKLRRIPRRIFAAGVLLAGCAARQRGDGLSRQRRLGGGREQRFALPRPGGIVRLTGCCTVGTGFEDLLMAEGNRFFDFEH